MSKSQIVYAFILKTDKISDFNKLFSLEKNLLE